MQLEFRHLRILLTIAEAGSIRKAAARLQLSQPATTAQLKRIEQELGGPLFLRSPDGVKPNQRGQYVLRCAGDLVTGFERLRDHARSAYEPDSAPASPLRAGGMAGPLVSLLISALFDLLPDRPVTTDARRSNHALATMLNQAKLDIAVLGEFPGFPLPAAESVMFRTVLHEPVFVLLADDHPLARQDTVKLHELAAEDWVMPEADESGMHVALRLACEAAGFTPRLVHTAPELSVAQTLVASGRAISGVWPTADVQQRGVALRPVEDNPLHRRLLLSWNAESVPPELAEAAYSRVYAAYLALVQQRPLYRHWWAHGGREFALSKTF